MPIYNRNTQQKCNVIRDQTENPVIAIISEIIYVIKILCQINNHCNSKKQKTNFKLKFNLTNIYIYITNYLKAYKKILNITKYQGKENQKDNYNISHLLLII